MFMRGDILSIGQIQGQVGAYKKLFKEVMKATKEVKKNSDFKDYQTFLKYEEAIFFGGRGKKYFGNFSRLVVSLFEGKGARQKEEKSSTREKK